MSDNADSRTTSLVRRALQHIEEWEASWGEFDRHPALDLASSRLDDALDEYLGRLEGNYPFHHPRYAGQMLKPPHPVAVAAYVATQRINPNNHALDGGPPTSRMEKEVITQFTNLLGLPTQSIGHLTGGGTVANLEALWIARELDPDRAVAVSDDAHYTHGRMSNVLDVEIAHVPTDSRGRMKLDALRRTLQSRDIGTIVLTAGTTGLGSVDPIAEVVELCSGSDVRLHVDAAYGGFFRLLSGPEQSSFDGFPARHFQAIESCDSVAIDPHKHGLQPYGCGCILFRDPAVGRFYKHDSPYTYFTSDELHLGEISLECSRAGAAAGALWCTLRALPLRPDDGLGPILQACLRAARRWADEVSSRDTLNLVAPPETDIVAYYPTPTAPSISAIDQASNQLFRAAMDDSDEPFFPSLYQLPAETLTSVNPELEADQSEAAVLRSVLMKPEHEDYAQTLVDRLHTVTSEQVDSAID